MVKDWRRVRIGAGRAFMGGGDAWVGEKGIGGGGMVLLALHEGTISLLRCVS